MLVAAGRTAALITLSVNSLSVSDPFRSRALTPAEPAPTAKKVAITIVFFIESAKNRITRAVGRCSPPSARCGPRIQPETGRKTRSFSGVFANFTGPASSRLEGVIRISDSISEIRNRAVAQGSTGRLDDAKSVSDSCPNIEFVLRILEQSVCD